MYSYYNSNLIEEFFSSGGAAITGVVLTILIIVMIVAFVLSTIVYVLSAFPLYKLAKKLDRPYAWLAWIPIVGTYFRTYVLCDLAGDKELVIIPDKIVIKDRKMSFLIYLGIVILGSAIVGTIIGILSLIPIIGWFSYILAFAPIVCAGFMEYAYLRDVLDIFKEDKQSNKTTSIIVTVLDCLVTYGIARIVILFTLLKREPIAQNVVNCEANPAYTAPAYTNPTYAEPAYTQPSNTPPVAEAPAYTAPTYTTPVEQAPVVETTPSNTDNNAQ